MTEPGETVVLFTQDGCPSCDLIRACLRLSRVPFVERNVTADRAAAADLAATGLFATPVVVAGGRAILAGRRAALAADLGFRCRCPDGGR